jgi:hypothetical protein
MCLSAAIPILRIFSEEKAKEFYLDFLGFRIEWEHRFTRSPSVVPDQCSVTRRKPPSGWRVEDGEEVSPRNGGDTTYNLLSPFRLLPVRLFPLCCGQANRFAQRCAAGFGFVAVQGEAASVLRGRAVINSLVAIFAEPVEYFGVREIKRGWTALCP